MGLQIKVTHRKKRKPSQQFLGFERFHEYLHVWSQIYRNEWSQTITGNSLIHHVHFVLPNLQISETHLNQFQVETKNNPILKTLITYATHEWPEKHLIPPDFHPPYTLRSDITFCEGILLKN